MDYTLTDRPPEFIVGTLETTVAEGEADVLVDGLTYRPAVTKV